MLDVEGAAQEIESHGKNRLHALIDGSRRSPASRIDPKRLL